MSRTKRKRKKGRQNVKRHWKPSLGRFVDRYDRTGEHARLKNKRAEDDGVATEIGAAAGPRIGRRLVISAVVFVVMLGVIGGFRLVRRSRVMADYAVLVATKPVLVTIDHGSATRVLTATAAERDEMVREAVESLRAAATEQGDRLVVIDLVAPVISFGSLSAADQEAVREAAGPDAAMTYETAVARLLEKVVTAVANRRVSVMGLPVEPGAAGIDAARRTNRRYAAVTERLDHLVTAHTFLRTESWLTERRMVEEAIPEALHRSAGRPIVFRLNLEWRVLVSRAHVGRYRRASWNTLAD